MAAKGKVTLKILPSIPEDVINKAIDAGKEILEREIKKNLTESIEQTPKHTSKRTGRLLKRSERTGGLLASERTSPMFINKKGTEFVSKVYFDGENEQGIRYGAIAGYKNYGVKKGRTQEASHFKEDAIRSKKASVIAAMQQVIEQEINS